MATSGVTAVGVKRKQPHRALRAVCLFPNNKPICSKDLSLYVTPTPFYIFVSISSTTFRRSLWLWMQTFSLLWILVP